jgi:hypothetical protein
MDRLSADEVGAAMDKGIVPTLREGVWRVCEGGYRIEGWEQNRYLVHDQETFWVMDREAL